MKKHSAISLLAIIFLGLTIIFNTVYFFLLYFPHWENSTSDIKVTIILEVIKIVSMVLLIVGLIKENKIFFCLYFGIQIFDILVRFIYIIITDFSTIASYPELILNYCSNITYNIFMLIFILIIFKWKDGTTVNPIKQKADNNFDSNTEYSIDSIIEYKKLLDDGVITKQEFDIKKNELLNL